MTNDNFREALRLHFGDEDIQSKRELGVLMQKHGFRKKYVKKYKQSMFVGPTQKQLDSAWEFLRERYRPTTVATQKYYYIEVKGFKKRQVRDKKTGRIIGWID